MSEPRPPLSRSKKSAAAAAIVCACAVPFEGIRYVAYMDPVNIPTICVGETKGVKMGDRATHEQCMAMLGESVMIAMNKVWQCQPTAAAKMTPNQLAAFTDMTYNGGPTAVCDTNKSTMARLLAAGQVDAACDQLRYWNKGRLFGVLTEFRGLTKRRAANTLLCKTPWEQT